MHERNFEIILFGATGFTGRIVANYLSSVASENNFRWAIAGRSSSKLKQLQNSLTVNLPKIIIADLAVKKSLEKMTAETRILINTVGAFDL